MRREKERDGGESERQEEIKKGGNPGREKERLEATNHKQGFDENLEGVFSCFPPQTPRPAKSPFLPPPAQFPAAKEVREESQRGRERSSPETLSSLLFSL